MKYVSVTGGVVSGLGKGVTASSIGVVLKACGLRKVWPEERYPKKRKRRPHSKVEGMFRGEGTPLETALAAVLASNNAIMECMEKFLTSLSEAGPGSRSLDNVEATGAHEAFTTNAVKELKKELVYIEHQDLTGRSETLRRHSTKTATNEPLDEEDV
ncbi:hypothetical protein RND71_007827 [Anisodus tanguticus]|uniref:CTP synthase N-terminal domain-containing protein n=1 Tax=Anisodus tanguticus TaxID=243964 RepID=A0AAE1VJF8_9SOLA|nr:hypothetical protein RND71_007827 [Anisodus tanguticus]